MYLAILMIPGMAPRTGKHLGQILAIIALAGSLAMALAVAIDFVGWGIWGTAVGSGLATGLGVLTIAWCFDYLGVKRRWRTERDPAETKQ